jgi:hypothetical protein
VTRALVLLLAAATPVLPLRFPAAPGWYVGNGHVFRCPATTPPCTESWSWTGTVGWRDPAVAQNWPERTTSALGRNGVMVAVTLIHDDPNHHERLASWPPRVTSAAVHGGYRSTGIVGIPERIGVFRLFARLGPHSETYVVVYFGRPHPTAAQLSAANARLASAATK